MPKETTSAGVDIAYEVVGEGTPLALLHLLFDTREFWWRSGYVDAIRSTRRQLVLIDASGHGESDKPHEPEAYSLERRANEVIAVLDGLNIERTEVLGYSMGGWTALGLVCYHPDRLWAAAGPMPGLSSLLRWRTNYPRTCVIGFGTMIRRHLRPRWRRIGPTFPNKRHPRGPVALFRWGQRSSPCSL